jgi:glycosyltransferase involved in cell wall biosynthesis
MKLLFEAPINSLSLGNVSINFLKELKNKNVEVGIFPTGNVDVQAYDLDGEFVAWLQESTNNRFSFLKKDIPQLKLWHLNGSENRKNPEQYLYTFYECSEPTSIEVAIAQAQNTTFFSSKYSANKFVEKGCSNTMFVPLGFDRSFFKTDKKYLNDVIHFGIMGKFEKRKNTGKIIQNWAKKYGNNNKYQLTCCVTNPFFKPEDMQNIIQNVLEGKRYTNINFLPYLQKNTEVNELLNAIDIDLTGLSFSEGWNLPSFNATCLGKWSIVHNATAHKDWATAENSILVETESETDCYDQVFFQKGGDFNQGIWPIYSDDAMFAAMEKAEKKVGKINTEGLKLADSMTYSNTVDSILANIFKD